ncbi:hypothetical protein RQP46_004043 [Phenoliferia psychrophenolica]
MAPATLLGLPTELKAHIVSLVAQQDDRFRERVAKSTEVALPALAGDEESQDTAGKSLSMLSLVNNELRILAAPHLFKLTHLAISSGAFKHASAPLASAVDNLAHLEVLRLDLEDRDEHLTMSSDWSEYPWKRPLRQLEIRAERLGACEWDFIHAFSSSLEGLTLRTDGNRDKVELPVQARGKEPRFPHLEMLSLIDRQSYGDLAEVDDIAALDVILQYFSRSPLVTLNYACDDLRTVYTDEHPFIKLLETKLPLLRFLHTNSDALTPPDKLLLDNLLLKRNITIV